MSVIRWITCIYIAGTSNEQEHSLYKEIYIFQYMNVQICLFADCFILYSFENCFFIKDPQFWDFDLYVAFEYMTQMHSLLSC